MKPVTSGYSFWGIACLENCYIKMFQSPHVIDLDDVHHAQILHCDNNVPELYIEHTACTDLNQMNAEIPVNLQTYVSPLETTIFLNATLMFDPDYIPETKVTPSHPNVSMDTGSIIGEVTTVKTEKEIKAEPEEIINDILTKHSPQCQLRVQITNIVSLQSASNSPPTTDSYSTESTIVGGTITPPAYALDVSSGILPSMTGDNISIGDSLSGLQDATIVIQPTPDETEITTDNDPNSQDVTLPQLYLEDVTAAQDATKECNDASISGASKSLQDETISSKSRF